MRILIVSDDKPGHFNQLLGIVSQLPESEFDQFEVRFKSKRRDNLLRLIFTLFGELKFSKSLLKSMLKFALTDLSYQKSLTHAKTGEAKYDLVISSGSAVASINLILARLNGAKSAVSTRPSPIGIRLFDLAILPQHQWPKGGKKKRNSVLTLGVPNRIDPDSISKLKDEIEAELKLSDKARKARIGVLVGGNDPHYFISLKTAKKLIDTLLKVCDAIDAELALTTSRRTPADVEELTKSMLSDQPRCSLLAVAGGTIAVSNPVSVILAISDITVVTEDSFSMVCEAASSGKKVVIVEVDRKNALPHPSRESAYIALVEKAEITRCKTEDLELSIPKLIADKSSQKALDDAKTAADAIRGLMRR